MGCFYLRFFLSYVFFFFVFFTPIPYLPLLPLGIDDDGLLISFCSADVMLCHVTIVLLPSQNFLLGSYRFMQKMVPCG